MGQGPIHGRSAARRGPEAMAETGLRPGSIRSVALIEPLGDWGIGGYAHELAEGLAANGVRVDVYTKQGSPLTSLPRRHRIFPVLGSFLWRQRDVLKAGNAAAGSRSVPHGPPVAAWRRRLRTRKATNLLRVVELVRHLERGGYDLVWTQWPMMGICGTAFWSLCSRRGIRTAHTVHNVLPHEERRGARSVCERVYRSAGHLIVHSEYAKGELEELFPGVSHKTIVAPHGLYSIFPRAPEARAPVRAQLGIGDREVALLFFGGIRPYKNIDAVLSSLAGPGLESVVLVVAGVEAGYPNLGCGDPLGRTRHLCKELGILDRVRLLPGPFGLQEAAELFEASDVLVLPYVKAYGSGLLLLGMTFQRFIVATATGGAEEYLAQYPAHVCSEGPGAQEIGRALVKAVGLNAQVPASERTRPPELEWPAIARQTLRELARNGGTGRSSGVTDPARG